jgi:inosine-uridine nucleoside N-ribohydrolase
VPVAALFFALAGWASAVPAQKIIFDTDFGMVPQDDAFALMLALRSPEMEILGVTTVAGNFSVEQATADALRLLEVAGRSDIKVYRGANMPLVHEKSEYATTRHGEWWSDAPPVPPPGGFAKNKAEAMSAVQFLIDTVNARPGQVTLMAIGPLTNVAMALRLEPGLAAKVKQIYIMGGAIARLPDGAGNSTPNAEFNFWVDPEAARIVLRSGIPSVLSPLNVSRKTHLTRDWYEKLVAVDTPLTRLIRERLGPVFEKDPGASLLMYDQVTVASLADPSLVTSTDLIVDVDANHDIDYGTSIGGANPWPGSEGAQRMAVQHGLDWDRFIRMFVERVTQPVP